MTNLTLSRRYAKALLAIGREDGDQDRYGKELADFAATLNENTELEQALVNPVYPNRARRAVLEQILAKAGYSKVVNNFLLLLQDKDRMKFLAEITAVYDKLVDELAGVLRAKVTSAVALDDQVRSRVQATLEKLTGNKVVAEFEENMELIGGLVAQVGDLVLDGSVRTQLGSLKDSLKGVG